MIIITVSLSLSLSLSLWHREKEREREREGTRYLDYLLPFFQRPDPTAIIMSSAHLLYRHHCSHTILSFALNHPHQKPQSIIIIIISRCKKEKEQKGERKRSQTCCTCVCKRRGISRRFSFLHFIDRAFELLAYLLLGFEWRVVSSFLRLSLKLESLLLLGNQASWSDYLLVSSKLITQALTYMCSSLLLRWTS